MGGQRKIVKIKPSIDWTEFVELKNDFEDAVRQDEMKGGGDPLDIPEKTANLASANARLEAFILRLKRELES